MVDTADAPRRRPTAPLPDHAVVPRRLGPDHEPRRRPRRGLLADHPRRRALPRLLLGDRRHQHRPRPPARRRGGRGAGREAAPRPAEHRVPRARPAALRPARAACCPAGRGRRSCRTRAPRRSRPSVKLARVATGRPAIMAFRYGYHGRTAQTMALTTAKDVYRAAFEPLPGSVYHTAYPYCYRAPGGAHAPTPAPATGRPSST